METAAHIIEELPAALIPATPLPTPRSSVAPTDKLSPEQLQLLDAMGYDPVSANQLQRRTQLSTVQVASGLVQLELENLITQQLDGYYLRN